MQLTAGGAAESPGHSRAGAGVEGVAKAAAEQVGIVESVIGFVE